MNYCFLTRVKVLHTFLISLVMLLSACGGGGGDSSSGGGSGTIYAGTYTGMETWTLSTPGMPSESGTSPLTIVIASSGDVVITDANGFIYTGSLTGESLSAAATVEEIVVTGAYCPATTVTYTGTISGTTITGSANGVYDCTLTAGGTFKVTISTTFTVMLQPEASATALGFNGNKRAMLENYVRDVVGR